MGCRVPGAAGATSPAIGAGAATSVTPPLVVRRRKLGDRAALGERLGRREAVGVRAGRHPWGGTRRRPPGEPPGGRRVLTGGHLAGTGPSRSARHLAGADRAADGRTSNTSV